MAREQLAGGVRESATLWRRIVGPSLFALFVFALFLYAIWLCVDLFNDLLDASGKESAGPTWGAKCHFGTADLSHERLAEWLASAEAGGTVESRRRIVREVCDAYPWCARDRMVGIIRRETDSRAMFHLANYAVWAGLVEALPDLQRWRNSLAKHRLDPAVEEDYRNPRYLWISFAICCDALGDHSSSNDLLEELRRDGRADLRTLFHSALMTDPQIVGCLRSVLTDSMKSRISTRNASLALRLCTDPDGFEMCVTVARHTPPPTAEEWLRWLTQNEGSLEWVHIPPGNTSMERRYRVGWWKVRR